MAVPWQQSFEAGNRAVAGGLYDAAVANYLQSLESARRSGDHQALADSQRALAKTYLVLGKLEEARLAATEAEEVDRVFWGYENQQVAQDMFLLAEALRRQGDFAPARVLFDRTLTVGISLFGEAHVDSLAVMIKMILLDLQEGEEESLTARIRQAVRIFSQLHPAGTFVKALDLKSLLQPYVDQNRQQEADAISQRIQATLRTVLGAEHPEIRYALQECSAVMKTANRPLSAWHLQARADVLEKKDSDRWLEPVVQPEVILRSGDADRGDADRGDADTPRSSDPLESCRREVVAAPAVADVAPTPVYLEARPHEGSGPRQEPDYLQETLTQAGSDMKPELMKLVWIASSVVCGILASLVYVYAGFSSLICESFMVGFLFDTVALCVLLFIAVIVHQHKLAAQIPDALEIMVSLLRAGSPITEVFQSLSETSASPLREEFARVVDGMRAGSSLRAALTDLTYRVRSHDLALLSDSIAVSKDTGGNLAEQVATIAAAIRARQKGNAAVSKSINQTKLVVILVGLAILSWACRLIYQPSFGAAVVSLLPVRLLLYFVFIVVAVMGFLALMPVQTGRLKQKFVVGEGNEEANLLDSNLQRLLAPWRRMQMQDRITSEFSNFLDMVVMHVESGVSLPQAVQFVRSSASASCPTFCQELDTALANMTSFKSSLPTAFRKIGEQYGVTELTVLAGTIDAAARTNSSIAYQLREQSKFLRKHLERKRVERVGALFTVAMSIAVGCSLLLFILKSLLSAH